MTIIGISTLNHMIKRIENKTMYIGSLFLILFLNLNNCFCQNNYFKNINSANEFFFIKGKADSSLIHYRKTILDFEKIFAIDAFTAFQIAIFSKEKEDILYFARKSFEAGVKMKDIQQLKLYQNFQNKSTKILIEKMYFESRKIYLQRIDTHLLKIVYEMYAEDQAHKTLEFFQNGLYYTIKEKHLKIIDSLIQINQFPSEFRIGLSSNNLMTELGHPEWELEKIYKNKYFDLFKNRNYIFSDDELFNWNLIVLLVHHDLCYQKLSKQLISEVSKYNFHPRDLETIKEFNTNHIWKDTDNEFYKSRKFDLNDSISAVTIWYYNPSKKYPLITKTKYAINRMKNNICTLQVEDKKWEYEKYTGFKLFFGFLKQR